MNINIDEVQNKTNFFVLPVNNNLIRLSAKFLLQKIISNVLFSYYKCEKPTQIRFFLKIFF